MRDRPAKRAPRHATHRVLWIFFLLLLLLLILLLASCAKRTAVVPPPAPSIEVLSCRLAAGDSFVEVRYRLTGTQWSEAAAAGMYLLDEASGERFYLMRLQRAEITSSARGAGGSAAHAVLFRNRQGILRAGSRVTIVSGPFRREGVLLEK